jgi:hypothetical protein
MDRMTETNSGIEARCDDSGEGVIHRYLELDVGVSLVKFLRVVGDQARMSES